MPESVANGVKDVTHAALEGFDEVFTTIAEYGAPLLGLAIGWVVGSKVGGVWTVANVVNDIVNPKNNASFYPYVNMVGGAVVGGVEACVAGYLWSASNKYKAAKTWGRTIGLFLLRFLAGMLGGMALNSFVAGFTNNPGDGWLDMAVEDTTKAATGGA